MADFIPCPHEAGDVAVESTMIATDHHSLTRLDVASLLNEAQQHSDDAIFVSKVQIRLVQGIIGMTCQDQ